MTHEVWFEIWIGLMAAMALFRLTAIAESAKAIQRDVGLLARDIRSADFYASISADR